MVVKKENRAVGTGCSSGRLEMFVFVWGIMICYEIFPGSKVIPCLP